MLGFVVLNYCSWKITIECVDSIINTYCKSKKIFVIDNASPNDSYKKLCEKFTDKKYNEVECILSEYNGGFARGNNIGIQLCKDNGIKYAIITNNDVIFNKNTIQILEKNILENKNAVQIGPKILNTYNTCMTPPWKSRQSLTQFLGIKSAQEHIYREGEIHGLKKVYMISGCCFIINIDKFINMGAFDEGTFLFMEEGTVSMSALKYEYDIMYNSDISVIHKHGQSTGRQNLFVDGEIIKSALYYWRKYERKGKFKLFVILIIMYLRSIYKISIGRTTGRGFIKFSKEIFLKFDEEIKKYK